MYNKKIRIRNQNMGVGPEGAIQGGGGALGPGAATRAGNVIITANYTTIHKGGGGTQAEGHVGVGGGRGSGWRRGYQRGRDGLERGRPATMGSCICRCRQCIRLGELT